MTTNGRRRALLGAGLLAALQVAAAAAQSAREEPLPGVADIRPLLAQVKQRRIPLLVLFSTPGCPFCREVRQNYLAPRLAEQAGLAEPTILIREVNISGRTSLIDQQGRAANEAAFAAQFNVKVVPVVALFDERLQLLAEPLVGIDRSGFYEAYLARAIERAQRALRP